MKRKIKGTVGISLEDYDLLILERDLYKPYYDKFKCGPTEAFISIQGKGTSNVRDCNSAKSEAESNFASELKLAREDCKRQGGQFLEKGKIASSCSPHLPPFCPFRRLRSSRGRA